MKCQTSGLDAHREACVPWTLCVCLRCISAAAALAPTLHLCELQLFKQSKDYFYLHLSQWDGDYPSGWRVALNSVGKWLFLSAEVEWNWFSPSVRKLLSLGCGVSWPGSVGVALSGQACGDWGAYGSLSVCVSVLWKVVSATLCDALCEWWRAQRVLREDVSLDRK